MGERFARAEGRTLVAGRHVGVERHRFQTPTDAQGRAAFVTAALGWLGTPFVDQGAVQGPAGAVDCAMLLVRAAVASGRLAPFDPRPYPPRWHLHRSEELFLGWVEDKLGARRVRAPRVGDLVLYQFGRCFSHGGIMINSEELLHAYYAAGEVVISPLDDPMLNFIGFGRHDHVIPRPIRYYSLWGGG